MTPEKHYTEFREKILSGSDFETEGDYEKFREIGFGFVLKKINEHSVVRGVFSVQSDDFKKYMQFVTLNRLVRSYNECDDHKEIKEGSPDDLLAQLMRHYETELNLKQGYFGDLDNCEKFIRMVGNSLEHFPADDFNIPNIDSLREWSGRVIPGKSEITQTSGIKHILD